MSQSSDDIESSGDGVRVLVLRAGGGLLGTGGTGERARVVDVRDTPEVVRSRAVSLTGPPDAAAPRAAAAGIRREDTEVVGGEVGRRGAVNCTGDVACLVRWRGVGGLRFATLFGADVVRARGATRVVVRLLPFASGTVVLRVDPDTVRWRTLFPGTDNVAGDAWLAGLDRTERREGGLLMGVVETGGGEGGVVVLSVARPLFAFMAGVTGSAAEKHGLSNRTSQGFRGARDAPAGSFANMVRTDDTIFRFPRAVAELTRFRTGSVSLFGGSLLASAGLSDVDFLSDVG